MKSTEERLMRYCRIDTESDENNAGVTPSSEKQFDLARLLEKEMNEMGLTDVYVSDHCYVYGTLKANVSTNAPKIGFVAHMDTAPQFSGKNVNPRIIRDYDGKDIQLNETTVISAEEYPDLKDQKGKTIMVADGTTLLGADDKAGIVAILEAAEYLIQHPEIPHGDIGIGFTPDEEIGNGPKYFDLERFGCEFGYTMDGGAVNELCYETFNAASAKVTVTGFSIHPGSAKGKMINAAAVAAQFQELTPKHMRPEFTEKREGFIHLTSMSGDCDHAELVYILRDHDLDKMNHQKVILNDIAAYLNSVFGEGVVKVDIHDVYRNMREVFDTRPESIEIAEEAIRSMGMEPDRAPARGGTDGATFSLKGMPCPNLGAGGRNFHGPLEYCVMEELDQSVELILKIVELVQKEN